MKQGIAVITGADGGMGTEITRAVAEAGYSIIMVCYTTQKGEKVKQQIVESTGNEKIEVMQADFSSMQSVSDLADRILQKELPIALLMNNAGTLETAFRTTVDGVERTVSINYLAPYLLTRKLLPLMGAGTRVVNMVSCTYAIGNIDFPHFFARGRNGAFWRIPIYSNTKLALLLFTLQLAEQAKDKGICINAADPGIVSTPIIAMHAWFDPLTDLFFRPFIRTPRQGADTAIRLLLDKDNEGKSGTFNISGHTKPLSSRFTEHKQKQKLWDETEHLLSKWV